MKISMRIHRRDFDESDIVASLLRLSRFHLYISEELHVRTEPFSLMSNEHRHCKTKHVFNEAYNDELG